MMSATYMLQEHGVDAPDFAMCLQFSDKFPTFIQAHHACFREIERSTSSYVLLGCGSSVHFCGLVTRVRTDRLCLAPARILDLTRRPQEQCL